MFHLLWLVPALPLIGFVILVFAGKKMPAALAGTIGTLSVGISALITILLGVQYFSAPPSGGAFVQSLWNWVSVGDLRIDIGFRFDSLTLTMMFVVTFVGFLIHLYSTEYMQGDGDYHLFFAYMNLFVTSMLILVMADNLVFLYLGWEGVGLCSYLLIGYWYRDPANGAAARKAFIVTRIGDVSMLLGIAILAANLGTLNIQDILSAAPTRLGAGSTTSILAAALLLGGAVGKSAQVPLQTWLPDAMAGPTPVSALIHAATMVTAGVYLIARTNVLFILAPPVQFAVAIIGVVTLLYGGFYAIAQADIKRVLAGSTISQIGYMFLGLGVGFWSAAMFHFMMHAFFKALLFLAAGSVILAQHHEQNMFKMGGLRKVIPGTFWTFLIGAASLSALPLVTAGFYSKEWILWGTWQSPHGGVILWIFAACLGVLLTATYTFRMVFLTFYGKQRMEKSHNASARILVPLVILAALSIGAGFLETPETLGHVGLFGRFLRQSLPASGLGSGAGASTGTGTEAMLQIIVSVLTLLGIGLGYLLYLRDSKRAERLTDTAGYVGLRRFLFSGLAFDWAYNWLFVRPYRRISRFLKADFIDYIYRAIALLNVGFNLLFSGAQTGRIRWYLAGIGFGAVVAIGVMMLL